MRISIFCSSQEISIKYVAQVKGLVQLLVHNGHSIVWGGSNTGLMRVVADTVEKSGGQLTGISVSFLSHYARPSVKDMVIAQDLNERKQLLLDKSDIVLVLPGGLGTLDEVLSVLELKKHGKHKKPILILNSFNFFEGLKLQLETMANQGFLPVALDELVYFAASYQDISNYIEQKLRATK